VSENDTLGSFIDGLFTSMFYQNREIFPSAVAHDRDAVLIMMSSRGETVQNSSRDQGCRQINAPVFEDLRRAPRKRSDEIDGIELDVSSDAMSGVRKTSQYISHRGCAEDIFSEVNVKGDDEITMAKSKKCVLSFFHKHNFQRNP